MRIRLLVAIALTVGCIRAQAVHALPPLGLTEIDADPGPLVVGTRIGVFDDTGYVSTPKGIWTITSPGTSDLIKITHPELDAELFKVTRVVQGPDNQPYFAATFRTVSTPSVQSTGAALYRLDEPTAPLVTWHSVVDGEHIPQIAGLDANLRGAGTLSPRFDDVSARPAEFFMDGTFEQLEMDAAPGEILEGWVSSISESGIAAGGAQPTATIGIEGALWSPEGQLTFFSPGGARIGIASSIRDRNDGAAFNIGTESTGIVYGHMPQEIHVHAQDIDISFRSTTLVSQSDFAAVNVRGIGAFVYYPGLVPDDPLAVLPIEDVFPELASVDVDMITDLDATPDGHIFMTLSGLDGLYLFGARDPSVIPEPTALTLAVLAIILALFAGQARAPKSTS